MLFLDQVNRRNPTPDLGRIEADELLFDAGSEAGILVRFGDEMAELAAGSDRFDLVFADPPYAWTPTSGFVAAVGAILLSVGLAVADWTPADGHKMHFPQLPDANGWDVLATNPKILADDWTCSSTGPVKDSTSGRASSRRLSTGPALPFRSGPPSAGASPGASPPAVSSTR